MFEFPAISHKPFWVTAPTAERRCDRAGAFSGFGRNRPNKFRAVLNSRRAIRPRAIWDRAGRLAAAVEFLWPVKSSLVGRRSLDVPRRSPPNKYGDRQPCSTARYVT